MSAQYALAYECDADGCTEVITGTHWTALGAQATTRPKVVAAGWLIVKDGKRPALHFCPSHVNSPHRFKYRGRDAASWRWQLPAEEDNRDN